MKNVRRLKIYYLKIDEKHRSVVGTSFMFAPRNFEDMLVEKGKSLRTYVLPSPHVFKILCNIKDLHLDHFTARRILNSRLLELCQCFPPPKVV